MFKVSIIIISCFKRLCTCFWYQGNQWYILQDQGMPPYWIFFKMAVKIWIKSHFLLIYVTWSYHFTNKLMFFILWSNIKHFSPILIDLNTLFSKQWPFLFFFYFQNSVKKIKMLYSWFPLSWFHVFNVYVYVFDNNEFNDISNKTKVCLQIGFFSKWRSKYE